MSRLPDLPPEEMTEAQRQVCAAIAAGPRGGVRGPFPALLRSPELADAVQKLGAMVRFRTVLPARLRELAILITGRFWSAAYEFAAHARLAKEAGLDAEIVGAIARRQRPGSLEADEAAVYDFCTEMHEKHFVSEALFQRAQERLGERGVVELVGLTGYYTLVSMALNAFEVDLPEGTESPFPD